jgi:alanyl-tRNA synthetase
MREAYPEMMESVQRVARIVKDEEHRYATTFLVAEKVFHDELAGLTGGAVPGASFKLYDTYGLALDEQEEMARERGFEIDREAFETEMKQQRDRARASWKGADKGAIAPLISNCSRRAARNSSAITSSTPLEVTACSWTRKQSKVSPPT